MASRSWIASTADLTEQVYQRLLYAICDGELAPGVRLTQEDLAATLGVSRQPVLQALRLLKKEGFVSDTGRRGLRVAPLEAQAITQVYEVRAVLAGLAARRAGPRIGSMIDADMLFHHLIYAASGNPLIAETANHHWPHIRRAMGAVLQTVGLRRPVWDEHEAILQAINCGDADQAERLAREHCARQRPYRHPAHPHVRTLDIIGNRRLAHAEETPPPHGHGFGPLPSGGRQEGGSLGGRENWGHPVRAVPPPNLPPLGGGGRDRLVSDAHGVSY